MKIVKLLLAVALVAGCSLQADERCGCNKPNNNPANQNKPRPGMPVKRVQPKK